MRTLLLVIAVACMAGGIAVAVADGSGPDSGHPVVVGDQRLGRAALGDTPERGIEMAWLAGEARERGLTVAASRDLPQLRAGVADAIAGDVRSGAGFAAAFDAFHAKWRARTRCLEAAHDPYLDQCANHTAAATGACHWMGAAWLCELRSREAWLVMRTGAKPRRIATRRRAVAIVRRIYERGRERRLARERRAKAEQARELRRERAEARRARLAAERQARRREAAARRARVAAERRRRMAQPQLSAASLDAAARACRAYDRAIDPYRFGAGLQDLEGQAEGFRAARRRAARGLSRAATDDIDARKLGPLLRALATGNLMLGRMSRASATGDLEAAYGLLSEFDLLTKYEARHVTALGLGDCLASPTSAG